VSTCQTCHSADARATKTECPACYEWRRRKNTPRPEDIVIKNNQRRLEQETLRRRRLP
jgi:hypothetical protein